METDLFIYYWDNVRCDFGNGFYMIISDCVENARLKALEEEYLSENDKETILKTTPELHSISNGLSFSMRGSA